jgi:hypothetical protein
LKDWLGQEYDVGDKIIYAASHGNHGHSMVIAEVIKFGVSTVTVRPLNDSRSGKRKNYGYLDERSGNSLDPYSAKNWDSSDVWDLVYTMHSVKRRNLHPYIKRVELPAKPVALKIAKNITKWVDNGELDSSSADGDNTG